MPHSQTELIAGSRRCRPRHIHGMFVQQHLDLVHRATGRAHRPVRPASGRAGCGPRLRPARHWCTRAAARTRAASRRPRRTACRRNPLPSRCRLMSPTSRGRLGLVHHETPGRKLQVIDRGEQVHRPCAAPGASGAPRRAATGRQGPAGQARSRSAPGVEVASSHSRHGANLDAAWIRRARPATRRQASAGAPAASAASASGAHSSHGSASRRRPCPRSFKH